MSRKRPLLVADLFCGAGGSSEGARLAIEALGRRMKLVCVNHWPTAIATHAEMHPDARHFCQDVASVRPHLVVPEGYLDLLLASPTCTYHSRARGAKPTSDQQRMDPWHVVTWLTELRVHRLILENVPEFVDWGPVNIRTGRPFPSRRGEYFRAWVAALEAVGHKGQWRIVNCADHGDATTRQRFFWQSRSDGRRIVWPQRTHSRTGAADLLGEGGERWRPARECIDWSRKGRSIFGRKKPLAPKTLQRILAGATKLGWPEPYIVVLRRHMAAQGIDVPLPTITAGGTHIGVAEPIILSTRQHTGGPAPRSASDPVPTLTATDSRIGVVEPFVLAQGAGGVARPVGDPVPTIPTSGAHALISPYYGSGSGETCTSTEQPLPTVTTKGRFGLAEPILIPQRSDSEPSRTVADPLPTITTVARIGMIVPVTHGGGAARSQGVDDPLPTLTCASRGELAFITPGFGEREGQAPRLHPVDEPMPTICAQGHAHVVEPAEGEWIDILFRMLEPHELAAAMSFDAAGVPYRFKGTKTEVIKQIGNAVPVRTSRALCVAALHDLVEAEAEPPSAEAAA